MNSVPSIHLAAIVVTALYGLVSLFGGTIGYVKAGSVASLVAGGISGLLLLLCAFGISRLPTWSLGGAMLIAVLLVGRFGSQLLAHRDSFSDFGNTGAGITAMVMSAGGVLVLVVCALALALGSQPPANQ